MTDENPIRVVLIDDHSQMHRIVQTTLGATADIKLVGQGQISQGYLPIINSQCRAILSLAFYQEW